MYSRFCLLAFGKSVIFQVIPSICSILATRGLNYPEKPIIVVICPLVSLINSHIQELRSRGFSAACLSGDDIDEKGIEHGDYSFNFTSPESVIQPVILVRKVHILAKNSGSPCFPH